MRVCARDLFRVNARGNAISGVNISRDANNRGTWYCVYTHGRSRMSRKSLSGTVYRARANVCAAFIGANVPTCATCWTFLLSRVRIVVSLPTIVPRVPSRPPSGSRSAASGGSEGTIFPGDGSRSSRPGPRVQRGSNCDAAGGKDQSDLLGK